MTIPVVGFTPTPFSDDDTVALDLLEDNARRMARERVWPAVLGGMGEFYAMDTGESVDVVRAAVTGAEGLVPVVAGVGFSTRRAAHDAVRFAAAGAEYGVVNPHYFAYPHAAGLATHIDRIGSESGLKLVVYSSPSMPLTPGHIDALCNVDSFAGVKETSLPAIKLFGHISRWGERINWWYVGELNARVATMAGVRTVTSSFANVDPAASRRYVDACMSGEVSEKTHHIEGHVIRWEQLLAACDEGYLGVLKAYMNQAHAWPLRVREPMQDPSAATAHSVAELIAALSS